MRKLIPKSSKSNYETKENTTDSLDAPKIFSHYHLNLKLTFNLDDFYETTLNSFYFLINVDFDRSR